MCFTATKARAHSASKRLWRKRARHTISNRVARAKRSEIAGLSGRQSERQTARVEIAERRNCHRDGCVAADDCRASSRGRAFAVRPCASAALDRILGVGGLSDGRNLRLSHPFRAGRRGRRGAEAKGSRTRPRTHARGGTRGCRAMAARKRIFRRRSLCCDVQPLAGMPARRLARGPFAENLRHRDRTFATPLYHSSLEIISRRAKLRFFWRRL